MITLLSRLFINNSPDADKSSIRTAYGVICSIVGILLNVLLFCGKYIAGTISGSIAITADAFNNLSDAGSSFITMIGFKFASKKPDPDHPFGHGRIEYISGFSVSVLIILMGFELAKSSFEKIVTPEPIESSIIAIVILIISICVKLYMAFYNTEVGKKIDSSAMKATAADSLSDTIATTVVLITMIISHFTSLNLDGFGGILVALFILYAGYSSAKDTLSPLLGQVPDAELVDNINKIVMSHNTIHGIHDLVVHDYGPGRLMISLHAEVPGDGDIYELHDLIDCIEEELRTNLSCEAVIHMDPVSVNNKEVDEMKKKVLKQIHEFDADLSIHDFRMVKGPTHTNLIFDAVIPADYKMNNKDVKRELEQIISNNIPNCNAVIKIDISYI